MQSIRRIDGVSLMQSSATQEYPSLIQTFFDTHTVGGVFLRDEDQRLYALGEYTDDQIMVMVRKGKQRGHIPSVGRVLTGRGKDIVDVLAARCNHTSDVDEIKRTHNGSGAGGDDESGDDEDANEDEEDEDLSRLEEALSINPAKHEARWCLGNAYIASAFLISNHGEAKIMFDEAFHYIQKAADEVSQILGFPSISLISISEPKWVPCLARVCNKSCLADADSLSRTFLGSRRVCHVRLASSGPCQCGIGLSLEVLLDSGSATLLCSLCLPQSSVLPRPLHVLVDAMWLTWSVCGLSSSD
ncbi:EF-hand domain pair containing protein [Tanacetum coccineum]